MLTVTVVTIDITWPSEMGSGGGSRAKPRQAGSAGICGAMNEHVADELQRELRAGDNLLIVGRRLQAAAARYLTLPDFLDSVSPPPISPRSPRNSRPGRPRY
jgi:hypothetical protein